jgi:tetratricopeptide (TPR) repeat protein
VSLSEQAISFMAAAAAAYGPRALAPPSEAAPDTPETLGRGLLRMLPGDPVPLADFLASPGHAWFSVGKLLYRQGDLGRARSVLQRLIDSHDPDWSEPARFQLINVMREQDDIDGLRAAAAGAAETARPEAAYAFVVVGEMLEDRGDADGARAAYQQAIDADWEFADDLRDKLSPPAADDSEDEAPPADLPPRFHPDNITRTGLDVLDHGLPPLPEELSYHMAIPVAYWVARQCAVVLFLMFPRHGRRQRHPMILQATYSRTGAGWTRDPYSSGTFFDHDPIARPGDMRDLGGQPMTSGGSMHLQEQPPPGYPAAVVTGRVDPAVTQIAFIQDGHEDRRPLQSHFGAWVVCAERLGPFQVAGLASDGTVLATLDYSFPLPPP